MKFKNDEQRMQHPQGKLIPQDVWDKFFWGELPDKLIPLMTAEKDALLRRVRSVPYFLNHERVAAWLAIAFSHPDLDVAMLHELSKAIHLKDYEPLITAATCGKLDYVIELDEKLTSQFNPDSLDFKNIRKYLFYTAAKFGHLDILQYLEGRAPEKLQEMIAANDYEAFRLAARHGHIAILEYLETRASDKLQVMIASDVYEAFRLAARHGHIASLEYLKTRALDKLQVMIAANDYEAFRLAARHGHIAILEYLETLAPDKLQVMIASEVYEAFQLAALYGHLAILQHLEDRAPDKLQDMIAANKYHAFKEAAKYGHLAILQHLEDRAPDKLQDMIVANKYHAFKEAAKYEHHDVVSYLLAHSTAFSYAEQHDHEYGEKYVHPFIANKLSTLRAEKAALDQENPNAVIDIQNDDEAKVVFYMIRNLIRRNPPQCQNDLIFLLEIPAVKALAHTEVREGIPNELLRLAVTQGNQMAAELLLNIPAVRELAEQHQLYHGEARGGFDLSALAINHESSMTALTTDEQQCLEAAMARNNPLMKPNKQLPDVQPTITPADGFFACKKSGNLKNDSCAGARENNGCANSNK